MSNEISTTFKVGDRHRCEMSIPLPITRLLHLECKWYPSVPKKLNKRMLRDMLRDYRRGRQMFVEELVKQAGGGNALVVEA
jgi:hypothetical protein